MPLPSGLKKLFLLIRFFLSYFTQIDLFFAMIKWIRTIFSSKQTEDNTDFMKPEVQKTKKQYKKHE
jgi:hypothetical protein